MWSQNQHCVKCNAHPNCRPSPLPMAPSLVAAAPVAAAPVAAAHVMTASSAAAMLSTRLHLPQLLIPWLLVMPLLLPGCGCCSPGCGYCFRGAAAPMTAASVAVLPRQLLSWLLLWLRRYLYYFFNSVKLEIEIGNGTIFVNSKLPNRYKCAFANSLSMNRSS